MKEIIFEVLDTLAAQGTTLDYTAISDALTKKGIETADCGDVVHRTIEGANYDNVDSDQSINHQRITAKKDGQTFLIVVEHYDWSGTVIDYWVEDVE